MAGREPAPDEGLRVLMVSARYLPFAGGTETHVTEVATRLAAAGHAVTVLTADPAGDLPREESVGGVRVLRVRSWPRRRDYHFAPGLVRHIRKGAWDIIHLQGYHTFVAPLAAAAALARGLPLVVTFHSGGHSSGLRNALRRVQHALLAPLLSRADRLIGVSQFEADSFSARMRVPRDRFRVIPNGARLPEPSGTAVRDAGAPLIVSLGRLERYKGHHRAIAAFAALRAIGSRARLRILGEGPYAPELRRLVAAHGLGDAVEIGAIPPGQRGAMADLLASASLVVLLSDYEAHPVAVMEALSLGVPVVTTDTSGFRELAERGLVRAVPLDASPDWTALVMGEALAAPPTAPVALPDWQDCADAVLATYREIAFRSAAPGRARSSAPAVARAAG